MNYWEIGSALESAAKAIKDIPMSIITNAVDDVDHQYKAMTKAVTDMQVFSQKCIADLKELDAAHLEECERILGDIKARREKIRDCVGNFNYEDVRRVNDLTEAIQKLRSINPKDLDLLVSVLAARAALEGE